MITRIQFLSLVLGLSVVGWPGVARAAIYYIDFATGSDANNGTSTSTPWKREPGDVNATGTSDVTTLAAGDTVKFKGGVVYSGLVIFKWSGSLGSPITYDGNSAGDWGTGRAIIDGQYIANASCMSSSGSRSHLVIRYFELRNGGGWADDHADVLAAAAGTKTNTVNTGGNGIAFYGSPGTNLYLSDLYIHRMGGWRNTQGWTQSTIQGLGIGIRNANGVVITNCEMTKMKTAIGMFAQFGTLQNVEVVNCDIHNYITWGVDVAPQQPGDTLKDITIRDTKIHDYAEFCQGNWAGSGEWPHTDGIFLRKAGIPSVWTNVRVFNNHFYCDGPPGNGGTASIYISQGASVIIYNNLFNQDSQTRMIGVSHANSDAFEQVVRIYNNTFISGAPAIILDTETDPARRKVYIQNNIFRSTAGAAANGVMVTRLNGVEPTVMDRNLYFDPGYTVATKYAAAFPAYSTFANLRAWYFCETNGFYVDPKHVNAAASPPSARDFQLTSMSPAVNGGANLSAYFTKDRAGRNRPATGAWDIGAYQFDSGGSLPEPPLGLQLMTNALAR